jgi:hypothetical protein
VQHLAGNAAVGDLLARQRRDAGPGGPVVTPPELTGDPELVLRLPSNVADLLTADGERGRTRMRTAVRLEGRAGSGGSASASARVASSARTTHLTGELQGLRPLDFDGPLTGVSATLAPDLAFALRIGRADLARRGNEASLSIEDDAVTLTVRFEGGEVRLSGEVGDLGDAPADWEVEVELDRRRCARLLAVGRSAGGRRSGGASAASPPEEPRRREKGSGQGGEAGRAAGPDASQGRPPN